MQLKLFEPPDINVEYRTRKIKQNLSQLYIKRLRLLERNKNRCLENWDELILRMKFKHTVASKTIYNL